ncbi:uncharacterized protein LOC119280732 [Triticum dicoccoides]|uniref:uncharacterized protein LOC119280732 n=1 Tax=Triticum dicoccoides TaxID=85692 RepID=UPI0018909AEF|nr:uncharacterized protein LOC119280732 [Triticum dicoccoides]
MQAHVKPKDIKRFEERLVEGKVYVLSNFVVCPSKGKYMTCRNPFMMHIEAQTVVDEIDGDVNAIPLHCFDFVDFVDVPSRDRSISLLTDVIGQVVEVWGIERTPKKLRMIEFCSLRIEDFSGKELYVTLYGKLGHDFNAEIRKKCRQDPVAAVFAGMRVCHYKGKGYIVCSLSASKYYLDLEIPEGQQFRGNWYHPKIPIMQLQSQAESPVDPTQELQSSWRTIKQLQSLDPFKLSDNSRFLCRATLKEIDCTKDWCYRGCFHCRKKVSRDGSEFWCSQCDPVNKKRKRPVLWYKLNAVVEDDTGTMNLVIFAEEAQELIGVPEEELFEEITDDGRCTVPAAFSYLRGSTHTFQVAMDDWSSSFVVKWILNHDELTLLQHGVIAPSPSGETAETRGAEQGKERTSG